MPRTALIGLAAFVCGCSNFHVVEPGRVYRCAQLSADGLRDVIADYGIRTVLRLRGGQAGQPSFEQTHGPVTEAGIDFAHVPLSAYRYPTAAELLELWAVFERAEYPVLLHCRAGADRSGLASAIYVLQRSGDLHRALEQLHAFPYLHLGWGGTDKLDEVFEMYEPYQGVLRFDEWVRYAYPF